MVRLYRDNWGFGAYTKAEREDWPREKLLVWIRFTELGESGLIRVSGVLQE